MKALMMKLGNKLIGIVTLLISAFAVAAILFLQYQQNNASQSQYQTATQQQVAEMMYQSVSSRVQAINKQVAYIASLPELPALLSSKNSELITAKQDDIARMFPSVYKVCLLDVDIDDTNPDGCIPITFATLNSLREAKNNGGAMVVMMQIKSKGAHLLFAQQVVDAQQQIIGVLVVALKADKVTSLLGTSFGSSGYVELQQGKSGTALLASKGNSAWRQGEPSFTKKMPDSYWQLAYWPQKQASADFPWILFIVALAIILLMGMLREAWQAHLLKHDIATLNQQLDDAEKGKLKKKYPLAFSTMTALSKKVQAMGLKYFQVVGKKGATAESLIKKMEADEQQKKRPANLDTGQEDNSMDYDSNI